MATLLSENDWIENYELLLTPHQVGARIKQLRRGKKLTQAQVAIAAGVSRQFISALERGHPHAELGATMKVGEVVGLRIA